MKSAPMQHLSPLASFILRMGLAGTFLGHGYYAFIKNPSWLPYFDVLGASVKTAETAMIAIGIIDFIVAGLLVFLPSRALYFWVTFWIVVISVARPLAGEPLIEIVKRGAYLASAIALTINTYYLKNSNHTEKTKL